MLVCVVVEPNHPPSYVGVIDIVADKPMVEPAFEITRYCPGGQFKKNIWLETIAEQRGTQFPLSAWTWGTTFGPNCVAWNKNEVAPPTHEIAVAAVLPIADELYKTAVWGCIY